MNYSELKIDGNALAARAAEVKTSIAQRTGSADNALPVAVGAVIKRFGMHGKARYTDYGPYWWALKEVLRRNGHDLGDVSDAEVAGEYRGVNDFETVIAADIFRDVNLASNAVGTRQFVLDGYSGEPWTLFDADMERG